MSDFEKRNGNDTKVRYYNCRGPSYVTKAGEVKHYPQVKAYVPRVKKFDVLLNDEEVKKILNDSSKTIKEREELIHDLINFRDLNFTYDQIRNFVYRNAKPQFNLKIKK